MPHPTLGDRSLFPALGARSYLAHCGISPVSVPVRDAVVALLESYERLGMAAGACEATFFEVTITSVSTAYG